MKRAPLLHCRAARHCATPHAPVVGFSAVVSSACRQCPANLHPPHQLHNLQPPTSAPPPDPCHIFRQTLWHRSSFTYARTIRDTTRPPAYTMYKDSIGQLVCGGFQGTTVTPQARELISKYKVSTMILLRKNAHSVQQMSKLIQDLQYIAKHAGYKYPLMFAIDEEGGMMNSLFDPADLLQFPGAMALAASGDEDLVYKVLRALALELRHIGFLIILGPVLDVITKLLHQLVSVRSFGLTVEEVVKYGKACARGLRDGGLLTVGKHFPGIGSARVDSLLELPMMTDSLDQIRRFNLVPFAEMIRDGLLDGISAAGCGVPSISPDETHACLLPALITQLLRRDMGFDGFVISECLEMDALYHLIGLGQGVVLAVYAGCDLVMVCHDFKLQVEAIESIGIALDNGILDEHIIGASLARLEKVRQRLGSWETIFPTAEPREPQPFRVVYPQLWSEHQLLSQQAYRNSITLVRDYESVLPLQQHVTAGEVVLVLTPLLNPVYPSSDKPQRDLYTGEEVFQQFGRLLAKEGANFNVLHTTYTANGLTPLHELLIETAKAVIIVTSEALRNMYQIGIVKYVLMLCGATPLSLARGNTWALLAKPLVIVATLSPYDFFYNKSIGSAYLCCYDYTAQALQQVAAVLMGTILAQGCIPGEKKFVLAKWRKRRSLAGTILSPERLSAKVRRCAPPKRRWLVDEFDLSRDWRGLLKLLKANHSSEHSDAYFRHLVLLLHTTAANQKHFVVRNSSLNILYGTALTWVDVDVDGETTGKLILVLVDRAKRLQLVGKNLHARAMRYLFKERGCASVTLGSLFPLVDFTEDESGTLLNDNKVVSFFNNTGWAVNEGTHSRTMHAMVLRDLTNWSVPTKIFRELTIVGVRFDICLRAEKIQSLVERTKSEKAPEPECNRHARELYREAMLHVSKNSPYEVKIIIALEPTNQSVIGSIILFTNKSMLARYYPFMEEEAQKDKKPALVGGIVCPVIDPSYSNLTEIFKFGLICSAITYLRSNFCDSSSEFHMNQCVMMDVADDKSLEGIKEIGFEPWKRYCQYHDMLTDAQLFIGE